MGAIYMVLTFSIMVPMALLTDAIINYLSAELRTNDADIQTGIQSVLTHRLLDPVKCDDEIISGRVGRVLNSDKEDFNEDNLRGMDARDFEDKIRENNPDGKSVLPLYFILRHAPPGSDPSGVPPSASLLRVYGDDYDDVRPSDSSPTTPAEIIDCKLLATFLDGYDVCPVKDLTMLDGASSKWKWEWIANPRPDPNKDQIICDAGLVITSRR